MRLTDVEINRREIPKMACYGPMAMVVPLGLCWTLFDPRRGVGFMPATGLWAPSGGSTHPHHEYRVWPTHD